MYKEHPVCIKPDDENVKIWRYLDLTKFLAILNNKALYFSRIDNLGDPFEGSLPCTEGQDLLGLIQQLNSDRKTNINIAPNSEYLYSAPNFLRKTSFASSFHVNSYESAALWSIYSKAKQGVAIQSTYKRLRDCFNETNDYTVHLGLIEYIDYTRDKIPLFPNILRLLLRKRKSFEHEKELRAIIFFPQQYMAPPEPGNYISVQDLIEKQPQGFNVPVNLDILIENIYVAPTTSSWVKELISSLMEKLEVDKKILQSDLDIEPII